MRRFLTRAVVLANALTLAACAAHRPPAHAPGAGAPVSVTATEADRQALVATALALVGTKYAQGGAAPQAGFDCSGFVTWVFQQHGVALPRTVSAQFASTAPVAPNASLLAGDLVFFEFEAPGPSHVGISIGGGRFVHAPSSRGVVRVEPLGSSYWARRYVGARRVLEPATENGSSSKRGRSDPRESPLPTR